MIEQVIRHPEPNLFRFLHHSLARTCEYLSIKTEIRISSTIEIDHSLKNQEKVIALSKAVGATTYVNAIGGLDLYSKDAFDERGLDLKFIRSKDVEYRQFNEPFVPWLSIIDVMMFNPVETIRKLVSTEYETI